jgi:D-cysteine desulfhydrase
MVVGFALVPAAVAAAKLAHRRERIRMIAPGGSDPIGTLGYVNAALELAAQCRAGLCPVPREIHVAGGTLGTAAGLALGVIMAGLPTVVVAHRITSRVITNRRAARALVVGVCRLLRAADPQASVPHPLDVRPRLRIEHTQIGRGYGFETDAGFAAGSRFADAGFTLDPTYTAKAAAGFLAAAREDAGPVLYWHTLSSVNAV